MKIATPAKVKYQKLWNTKINNPMDNAEKPAKTTFFLSILFFENIFSGRTYTDATTRNPMMKKYVI